MIYGIQVRPSPSKGKQRIVCGGAVWMYSGGEGRSGVMVLLVSQWCGLCVCVMYERRTYV